MMTIIEEFKQITAHAESSTAVAARKGIEAGSLETFIRLSHNELVGICSQSPSHPAWDEFYRRFDYYIKLYVKKAWKNRTINSDMENPCAREILRDLTQEVYLKLLENDQHALRKFKGGGENSFLAYLARIAVNIVAEYFRKQLAEKRKGRMISVDLLLDSNSPDQPGSRTIICTYLSCNPEADFLAEITFRELSDLLDQILTGPNQDRDKLIFKLYLMDGLSTQQVAAAQSLGLKTSSVESIIRRTRDKLRHALRIRAIRF
jgi:RNA polymerase sigma factor (sigma-70 family)